MLGLLFDSKVLEVQRKVVVEEFKQRYLNQPYGDAWLKFRPLAYKIHPYQWATIGKDPSHIEHATMDDVRNFFYTHYIPNNAVLVVAGKVEVDQVKKLAEEWFGPIPSRPKKPRQIPQEPRQTQKRFLRVEAGVPADALYMAWHMPGRFDSGYHAAELVSDLLGRGESSRLYTRLVKEKELFTTLSSYVTGTFDPGLLVVSGRLKNGITPAQGEEAVQEVIQELLDKGIAEKELAKVKNQMLMSLEFEEVEVLNRAINLAVASLSGNTQLVNLERDYYQQLTKEDLQETARQVLAENNCSVMHYCATPQA